MRKRMRKKKAVSISIISGADGPTSIFLAGKVGKFSRTFKLVTGIATAILASFLIVKAIQIGNKKGSL